MYKLTVENCRKLLKRDLNLPGCRAIFMAKDKQHAEACLGRLIIEFDIIKGPANREYARMRIRPDNVPACQLHTMLTPNAMSLFYSLPSLELEKD